MNMFAQLHSGDLPQVKLWGAHLVAQKKKDASRIEQYRPICLLNLSLI